MKFVIKTTLTTTRPRERIMRFPSREYVKVKIWSAAKVVNCLGGPFFSGCCQRLTTWFSVLRNTKACPSGVQRALEYKKANGKTSNLLIGAPPSAVTTAMLPCVTLPPAGRMHESILPSGEKAGEVDS